ncbi:hypothetical protein [Bradyrhizobium oligotrophicum]|uniref:hypothetical protein n=1 Tax=Bradyrhizobium oligotrophicum TaxID=44255 RepID=UPI003EB70E03
MQIQLLGVPKMTRAKITTGKDGGLTLSDTDMITKRVYGRRTLLREFGAALLGASAVSSMAATAAGAACDTDKRKLANPWDHFADGKMEDLKKDCKPKKK